MFIFEDRGHMDSLLLPFFPFSSLSVQYLIAHKIGTTEGKNKNKNRQSLGLE